MALLDALYEYAAERIAAEQVRINVGTVSIYPMIDGSFDSEDAPFDPKRNTLYVGAFPPSRFGLTSPEAATRC